MSRIIIIDAPYGSELTIGCKFDGLTTYPSFEEYCCYLNPDSTSIGTNSIYEFDLAKNALRMGLACMSEADVSGLLAPSNFGLSPSRYLGILSEVMTELESQIKNHVDTAIKPVLATQGSILNQLEKIDAKIDNLRKDDVISDSGIESVASSVKLESLIDLDEAFRVKVGTGDRELPCGLMEPNEVSWNMKIPYVIPVEGNAYNLIQRKGSITVYGPQGDVDPDIIDGLQHDCDCILPIYKGTKNLFLSIFFDKRVVISKQILKNKDLREDKNVELIEVGIYARGIIERTEGRRIFRTLIASTAGYGRQIAEGKYDTLSDLVPYVDNSKMADVIRLTDCGLSVIQKYFNNRQFHVSLSKTSLDWFDTLVERGSNFYVFDGTVDKVTDLFRNTKRILERSSHTCNISENCLAGFKKWINVKTKSPSSIFDGTLAMIESEFPDMRNFLTSVRVLLSTYASSCTSPRMLKDVHNVRIRDLRLHQKLGKIRYGIDGNQQHVFCPSCGVGYSSFLLTQVCHDYDNFLYNVCNIAPLRNLNEHSMVVGEWRFMPMVKGGIIQRGRWPIGQSIDKEVDALLLNSGCYKRDMLSIPGRRYIPLL